MLINLQEYRDTRTVTHCTWYGDALCSVVNKQFESSKSINLDLADKNRIKYLLMVGINKTINNLNLITKLKLGIIDFNKIISSVKCVDLNGKKCLYHWQIIGDNTGIGFYLFNSETVEIVFYTKYNYNERKLNKEINTDGTSEQLRICSIGATI